MIEEIEEARNYLLILAHKTLQANQDCFVANWVLQNPGRKISEVELCHSTDWCSPDAITKFWIKEKE